MLLSLLYILNAFVLNEFIISDEVYFSTYSDQLSFERIDMLINFRRNWVWIGYILIPIILLVKILLITLCIEIGVIFKDYKISIKNIFHTVLIAELIFLTGQIVRIIALYFLKYETLEEIQYFYPLSILSLFEPENLAIWMVHPLQVMNAFVLAYFFLLAYGLSKAFNKNFTKMLPFTFGTFGICLLIWVMLVMFININYL